MKNTVFLFFISFFFLGDVTAHPEISLLNEKPATASIEGTIAEVLRILSTPEEDSNWDDFRVLFLTSADLSVIGENQLGQKKVTTFDLESFVRFFRNSSNDRDFEEVQLHVHGDSYNGIAQVFQTFEVSWDGESKQRGINSYQLVFVDGRWWIANIIWSNDANGVDIPAEYLPK